MTNEAQPRRVGRPKGSRNRKRPDEATPPTRKAATNEESAPKWTEAERDSLTGDWRSEKSAINKYGDKMKASTKRVSKYDIKPGDFVYRPNPHKKLVLSIIPLDNSQSSSDVLIDLLSEGYQFATEKLFSVRPMLKVMWKPNKAGNLTVHGFDTKTMALVWTTKEIWESLQEEKLALSNQVDKHFENEMRAAQVAGDNPMIEGVAPVETEDVQMTRS